MQEVLRLHHAFWTGPSGRCSPLNLPPHAFDSQPGPSFAPSPHERAGRPEHAASVTDRSPGPNSAATPASASRPSRGSSRRSRRPDSSKRKNASRRVVGRPGKIVRLANQGVCVLGCVVGAGIAKWSPPALDGAIDAARPEDDRHAGELRRLGVGLRPPRPARSMRAPQVDRPLRWGSASPGCFNRREGRSIVSPNVHQLDGRNLGRDLAERLKIECTRAARVPRPVPGRADLRRGPRHRRLRDARRQRRVGPGRDARGPDPARAQRLGRRIRPHDGRSQRTPVRLRQPRLPGNGRHRRGPVLRPSAPDRPPIEIDELDRRSASRHA